MRIGINTLAVVCGPRGVIYSPKGPSDSRIGIDPLIPQFRQLGYCVDQANTMCGVGGAVPFAEG